MATFFIEKVVSALPGTLTPNTIYLVRTGAGFDFYVSDSTGQIAHKSNGGAADAGTTAFFDGGTPSTPTSGVFKVDFGGVA